MRIVLLVLGCVLMIFQNHIHSIGTNFQFVLFITGIIIVGIPHGAADLLVAERNADSLNESFSKLRFLLKYLSRLAIFALLIWLVPVAGISLFVLFAAYHFGETDLHSFKTDNIGGKLFVISYGLFILSIILIHHFDDVRPIVELMTSTTFFNSEMHWISENRYLLVSLAGIFFFVCSFLHFLLSPNAAAELNGEFLVQLGVVIIILFNLPMLLGFSFYFVIWHSVISLKNIIGYLRKEAGLSASVISKQLTLYSLLSIVGISVFGWIGFSYLDQRVIAVSIFLGLAVLTLPHMEVMHEMYARIRVKKAA